MSATQNSSYITYLTPHFQLGEFALWVPARRFRAQHQVLTATELAGFLEKLRAQFGGRPVLITSGYRPPEVNRQQGGASGSEHLYNLPGEGAVDVALPGIDLKRVESWINANWPYSVGLGAHRGFVHVGIRAGRRRLRWGYE